MILGLDFDGTMHDLARSNGFLSCRPRFESVLRDYPAVDLLGTTAYRIDHSLAQIRSLFSDDIAVRIVGVTPNRYIGHGCEAYQREREILEWMKKAGRQDEPWLALDDADWLFSPMCRNLILVDPKTGFDQKEEVALRAILKKHFPQGLAQPMAS